MFFILNLWTSQNQIPTTNRVLKRYQNVLWVMSKKEDTIEMEGGVKELLPNVNIS